MSVSATKGSNFGREKQGIYAAKDRGGHGRTQHFYQSSSSQDNVELSKSALELLKGIQEQTHALLKKYPSYKSYFIDPQTPTTHNPISQAIHFLGKTKSFLNDAEVENLANQDLEFADFYQEIHRLANHNEEALKKIQEESRSVQAPTYHKLVQ